MQDPPKHRDNRVAFDYTEDVYDVAILSTLILKGNTSAIMCSILDPMFHRSRAVFKVSRDTLG